MFEGGSFKKNRFQDRDRRRLVVAKWILAYSSWLTRNHRWILRFGVLLFAVGAYYSVLLYKNLHTDMEELLPETAQSVKDVRSAAKRLGGLNHLSIVIETSNIDAAIRFSNAVSEELRKLPKSLVDRVQNSIFKEQDFFKKNKALYIDLKDWKDIERYVRDRARFEKKNRGSFSLGLLEEEKPQLDFESLREKYKGRANSYAPFSNGYFQSRDGRITVVLAFLPGKVTDQGANDRLSKVAHEIVDRLSPKSFAEDMIVGFDGDVQNVVEEHRGLTEDLILSSVIVALLCFFVLLSYFRSFFGVYALCASVFLGVAATFGLSYWIVGYLNANTAFMGSIVVGNGINFGIIFAARYFELKKRVSDSVALVSRCVASTAQATWVAALAAGTSYASLMATDFRGFNQFGIIGGLGMVFCWVSSFLFLPAFLIWFETRGWIPLKEYSNRSLIAKSASFLLERSSKGVAIATLIFIGLSPIFLKKISKEILESDFSKLRNKRSMIEGSGFWGKKVDLVFERYLTPTIIAANDVEGSKKIEKKLRLEDQTLGRSSPISNIQTIESFLPENQLEKIKIIESLQKKLSPKILKSLSLEDRKIVEEFFPHNALKQIGVQDLPQSIRTPFQELDGTLGRIIHVYPNLPQGENWDGREVLRFTDVLRKAISKSEAVALIAGQSPISADMITTIANDGPKSTLIAFCAVFVLVLFAFPNMRYSVLVLSSLLLGALGLAAFILIGNQKINFLNFIALPITFGIGVDYSVNIFNRHWQLRTESILDSIRSTGGAVVLCSLTTIIGYGSLLLAGSQAFVSFGLLAVFGEISCLGAAVLAIPSLMITFSKYGKIKSKLVIEKEL